MSFIKEHRKDILISVFSAMLAFVFAWLLYLIQAREPHLSFDTVETLPFQGPKEMTGIYHVTLMNDGSKEAEDVVCVIQVPKATVTQKKVNAPKSLAFTETSEGDSLRLSFPELNPQDVVNISVLASAPENLPSQPEVSFRGKGVNGVRRSERNEAAGGNTGWNPNNVQAWLGVIAFGAFVLFGIFMYANWGLDNLLEMARKLKKKEPPQ
jgi:hypothetical protein